MADPDASRRVSIVGLHGGRWFGEAAGTALRAADVLVGAARHLDALPAYLRGERVDLTAPVDAVLDLAEARHDAGEAVCILASGDPGFFGITRLAAARFPVVVHPSPAAVSLAFARAGTNWDDAVVVSAHGRPLTFAVEAVVRHPKVAVLTSPDAPPEALGSRLLAAGCGTRRVTICSRLGEAAESVIDRDLDGLATGMFDPLSVVIVQAPDHTSANAGIGVSWGRPDHAYAHRDGMVTKAEVRAVILGKLRLPPAGVLWDVGAGSGSVAVDCAHLAPGLGVYAVERRPDDIVRIEANAAGTGVRAISGEAPGVLADLPDPDRVFVGGGGLEVLDAALARLRPGGTVVASYAVLDRAAAAAGRLGHVVQVSVSRGVPIGDGDRRGLRLAAENPVFVCWGPQE